MAAMMSHGLQIHFSLLLRTKRRLCLVIRRLINDHYCDVRFHVARAD